MGIHSSAFGNDFIWGVASSAFQTEGAWLEDGKGLSIWDVFTSRAGTVRNGHHAQVATDFYHRHIQDIILMQYMQFRHFRFSISWPRLFPEGKGLPNEKGADFYDALIDHLLESGIEPWITLYHWDLPQALEDKGGWQNRDIISWFQDYISFCIGRYGDRVKNWMVLNEPVAFTGAGYFLGLHAPGKKGLSSFLSAAHHAALAQAAGGSVIRSMKGGLHIGTTLSCAPVDPADNSKASHDAAKKIDVITNRLFIEPLLGMGYPWQDLKVLEQIEKYMQPGDEKALKFDFDFIGLQNYTREVVTASSFIPYLGGKPVKASRRNVPHTAMDWEICPGAMYRVIRRFNSYPGIKKIIITENGAGFEDQPVDGKVEDYNRIDFYRSYLEQVLRAKREGMKVAGYFAWSFTDNFEWAEGYRPRFGLVYVDFNNQKRIIKSSGFWFREFLTPLAQQTPDFRKAPQLTNS